MFTVSKSVEGAPVTAHADKCEGMINTLVISSEARRGTLAGFILPSPMSLQMSSNVNRSTNCKHVLSSACHFCPLLQFVFLTYILALTFIAIFGFTAIPVFLFFNMWSTCAAMRSPDANITSPDSICVDVRQYG